MRYLNALSISSLVLLLLAYLSNVYISDCFNAALALAPAVLLIVASHRLKAVTYTSHFGSAKCSGLVAQHIITSLLSFEHANGSRPNPAV